MSGCGEPLFCDEMLARRGRWLRAAGYDVAIASPGERDGALLQRAAEERRLFITRDRRLLEHHAAAGRVILLQANTLAGQFAELSGRLAIDWLCKPFSRCLGCNSELIEADAQQRVRVPAEALREDERLLYCPRCDKSYWSGSHVKRMRLKLEHLSRGEWDANVESEMAQTYRGKKHE